MTEASEQGSDQELVSNFTLRGIKEIENMSMPDIIVNKIKENYFMPFKNSWIWLRTGCSLKCVIHGM